MKLRWLERDGTKVLQYQRDPETNEYGWFDVPTVTEKKEWCEHWSLVNDPSYGKELWMPIGVQWTNYVPNFCPWCGKPRPK